MEDTYRSIGRDLATVLRVAERVGASGQYLALADDGNDGERTVLEDGGSRVESIVMLDVLSGAANDPGDVDYAAVVEEIYAGVRLAVSAPPKKAAPKKPAAAKNKKKT